MENFRMKPNPETRSGLITTTASAARAPFLVPPRLSTSAPLPATNSPRPIPRAAAALAILAPSICTPSPCPWAVSARALSCSTV